MVPEHSSALVVSECCAAPHKRAQIVALALTSRCSLCTRRSRWTGLSSTHHKILVKVGSAPRKRFRMMSKGSAALPQRRQPDGHSCLCATCFSVRFTSRTRSSPGKGARRGLIHAPLGKCLGGALQGCTSKRLPGLGRKVSAVPLPNRRFLLQATGHLLPIAWPCLRAAPRRPCASASLTFMFFAALHQQKAVDCPPPTSTKEAAPSKKVGLCNLKEVTPEAGSGFTDPSESGPPPSIEESSSTTFQVLSERPLEAQATSSSKA